MRRSIPILALLASTYAFGQTPDAAAAPTYTVETGTRIALGLISSVSTKHSVAGERIYLETVFPVVVNSHIVIPPGSYVAGTVTEVKKPGRISGHGQLFVRFDSITLPNGVTREFRSRLGSVDARGTEHLDKEGVVQSDSNKGGDVKTVATGAGIGASVGAIAGNAAGHGAMGSGIGAGAGALAGLAGVFLTRGPDAELTKGSTIEMILDRPLIFDSNEVNFAGGASAGHFSDGPGPKAQQNSSQTTTVPGTRRMPF